MEGILYLLIFLAVLAAVFVWFVISLVLFIRTDKADAKKRPRKIMFIISAIIAALFLIVVTMAFIVALTVFIVMFLDSIGHM